jgi:hypothetical protein
LVVFPGFSICLIYLVCETINEKYTLNEVNKVAWQIVTKKINGNNYLYAKSTKRAPDGSIEEKYLGTPDDVVAMVDSFRNPPQPQITDKEFGAVAALWSVAERLQLRETLDSIFPKRNSGPSVGEYLLVGAISRVWNRLVSVALRNGIKKLFFPGCWVTRPNASPASGFGIIVTILPKNSS